MYDVLHHAKIMLKISAYDYIGKPKRKVDFVIIFSHMQVFFINHVDKKTTWVDPRTGRPSPLPQQSNVPNRRHEDDLGPLPEGKCKFPVKKFVKKISRKKS